MLYPGSGEADVQVGSFTMRQPLSGLTRLSNREAARRAARAGRRRAPAGPHRSPSPPRPTNASLDVDLRGMRAVETSSGVLDRALNDAVLAGNAVSADHPRQGHRARCVRSCATICAPARSSSGAETAPDQQGGEGVTIARLTEE